MSPVSTQRRSFLRRVLVFVELAVLCGLSVPRPGQAWVRWLNENGDPLAWANAEVVLNLILGNAAFTLELTGNNSWDGVAVDAAARWNQAVPGFTLDKATNPTQADSCKVDGLNTVAWDFTACGLGFGDMLAITTAWHEHNQKEILETDVIFNTRYCWNAYLGSERQCSTGGPLIDLHRVAIHEFGHVLGLGHPDEQGQNVVALMNSRSSDVDRLQADDIAGGNAIHGGGGSPNDVPVVGYWNSQSHSQIGIFRRGDWFIDFTGNFFADHFTNQVDDLTADHSGHFGGASDDIPLVATWNNYSPSWIGVFNSGWWYFDRNYNLAWDGCEVDMCFQFGTAGDIPFVIKGDIGVFRNGTWYIDLNGNFNWDGCGIDACVPFGTTGDIPVVGDWNGLGYSTIGVFRNGTWYLDRIGNFGWEGCGADGCFDNFHP